MAANLACDKFWVNKSMYHDAEKKYYESLTKLQRYGNLGTEKMDKDNKLNVKKKLKDSIDIQLKNQKNIVNQFSIDNLKKALIKLESENAFNEKNKKKEIFDFDSKPREIRQKKIKDEKKSKRIKNEKCLLGGVGMTKLNQDSFPKTSLAGEVAKARQHIKSSLECMDQSVNGISGFSNARLTAVLDKIQSAIEDLTRRVEAVEKKCATCFSAPQIAICPSKPQTVASKAPAPAKPADDDDDDVDLFGSDSEEESEEAKKIREQRLADYAAKKSKKPAVVAKSNIILDIKPWDDETDMKEMEKAVRGIEMDGLIWGASKLVPVAFKIFKLQISCVIEDDKVSVDLLTETLEAIEDFVQSVDIAAFNKV